MNHQVNWLSYSLDGESNVTITGNSTLTGLPVGAHNVTIYAWDAAGNIGASETVSFTVAEPFPVVTVAAVLIIAIVAGGLLVYFKKHKTNHKSQT